MNYYYFDDILLSAILLTMTDFLYDNIFDFIWLSIAHTHLFHHMNFMVISLFSLFFLLFAVFGFIIMMNALY